MTWSEDFFVDQHVTEISAYITVSHFFSDTSSSVLPNESRYVRANLQDAAGAIVWETEISESRTEPLSRMQAPFSQGEWSLSVEARGYGEQFLNQFQDSFLVAIEVENLVQLIQLKIIVVLIKLNFHYKHDVLSNFGTFLVDHDFFSHLGEPSIFGLQ